MHGGASVQGPKPPETFGGNMPSITNFVRLFVALALAMITAPLLLASSASAEPDPNQVVVCKYSHTPVVGEIAQTVNIVNTSALEGDGFAGVFPFLFSDQHSSSVAIRFAEVGENTGSLDDPAEECPPFGEDLICPEGTDHAGEEVPEGESIESFCNDPAEVCPEGTDNAGQEIPEGQTADEFCDDVEPPAVCPDGTDNAGQEIPEGQTAEDFCDDADVPIDPVVDPPAPVVDPPAPTLPNTGTSPYLTALGLMGALILAAGSTLFMRSRKVRVPRA